MPERPEQVLANWREQASIPEQVRAAYEGMDATEDHGEEAPDGG